LSRCIVTTRGSWITRNRNITDKTNIPLLLRLVTDVEGAYKLCKTIQISDKHQRESQQKPKKGRRMVRIVFFHAAIWRVNSLIITKKAPKRLPFSY
jgi:hypothetical protein